MTDQDYASHEAHDGQGMAEYGTILVLASIAAVAIITLMGPFLRELYQIALDAFP